MPDSPAARLPADVSAAIFDELRDHRASLRACSLVCWKWMPVARRRLFAELRLRIGNKTPRPRPPRSDDGEDGDDEDADMWDEDKGWDSGSEEPDEKMAIGITSGADENGCVCGDSGRQAAEGVEASTVKKDIVEWSLVSPLERARAIIAVFASPYCTVKPYVRTVRLKLIDREAEPMGKKVSAAVLRAISTLPALNTLELMHTRVSAAAAAVLAAGLPSVARLTLNDVDLPINIWAILAAFPALKDLTLYCARWPHSTDAPTPLTLRVLHASTEDLLRFLLYIANRSAGYLTVHKLAIDWLREDAIPALAKLLPRIGGLAHLVVQFENFDATTVSATFAAAVDLGDFPRLRTLHFACTNRWKDAGLVMSLPTILSRTPALEHLKVELAISRPYDKQGYNLKSVDAVLALLTSLQTVELVLDGADERADYARIKAAVLTELPELGRRGILDILIGLPVGPVNTMDKSV